MDRWKRVEDLFHAGMEQPPDRRLAFVREACPDDPQLREEVMALLGRAELTDSLLDSPVPKGPVPSKRLSPGDKVGKFEVVMLLGAGGMGEVYRAHDVKLGREVAVKVLPAVYASDAGRRARLEREAQAASALNHPHICTIHGLEEHAGQPMIVMELVEGETLASRLARGALPFDRARALAIQLAGALAAAHRKGIVHRDLKPANVMLTKSSGIKVLDFGLAKVEQPLPGGSTVTQVTQEGQIMGTLQYMSPEQVQGADADARSDIFSFGLILYEMVSGKPAFRASNQASLIAAILHSEPEPIAVAPGTGLHRILRRALAKDPEDRWQSARDLMFELESLAEPPAARAQPRRIWPWVAAAATLCILAGAGGFGSARWSRYGTAGVRDWTFTILPPMGNGFLIGGSSTPEISPDGTMVAARIGSQLGVRRLDSAEFVPLRGAENPLQPFWSPDSKWLAFFGGSGDVQPLVKVRVPDGAAERVVESKGHARGGTWSRNGDFLFATDNGLWISPADAAGRAHRILPDGDPKGLFYPLFPHYLPDGEHFTFLALNPDNAADEFSGRGIYLAGWSGGRWTRRPVLLKPNLNEARYSPAHGGCVLYLQNDNLYAQRLNVRDARLEGSPELVLKSVASSGGAANFSVSPQGPVAWRPGAAMLGQLTWFDRRGQVIGTTGPPAHYDDVALSPDERRVAATVEGPNELRVMETGQSGFLRIATVSRNADLSDFILWARDSEHVLYCTQPFGQQGSSGWLMEQSISGAGEPVRLRRVPTNYLYALTPDRESFLTSDDARHLVLMSLAPGGRPLPLLQPSTTTFQAVLSPDGKWIAYESGGEILVERYPAGGDRKQISDKGGRSPYWRPDGKEILYAGPKNFLFSVVADPARGVFGAPAPLFSVLRQSAVGRSRFYAVTRDGSRILVSKYIDQPGPHLVSIAADWEAELRKSSR